MRDGKLGKLTGATRREIRPPEQKPEGIRTGGGAAVLQHQQKATEMSGSRGEEKDESPCLGKKKEKKASERNNIGTASVRSSFPSKS